ncbi:hypothetical protein [Pseudomonas turukhanskensis]|uniref:Uncharacterized protein n=1 Tax=Pseudomonas turukhanskensis TaxID=1806536 RepID=A0A9W6NII2_9PSED|nr:hypothetical protein [Pseudomonas turukhanskensis]GLK92218.1 hypothetical protein GCM10017655_52830 [Pseudomonas turukhanskensis]
MHEGLILCRFIHFGAVMVLFGMALFRSRLFAPWLRAFEAGPAGPRLERQTGVPCVRAPPFPPKAERCALT